MADRNMESRTRQPENCRYIVIGYEQRAFDSLSPQLLINKLQACNFSDKAIQLIRSYFQGRENRVMIGSVTSDWVVMREDVHREALLDHLSGIFSETICLT